MQLAPILFARNNNFFSYFIRLFTLSNWCHCAILDGEYVIDTTLLSGGRRIPFSEWKEHYPTYTMRYLPINNQAIGIEYARSRVGKKYDKLGILSFILYKDYEDKDCDFCSELVANYLGIKHKPWSLSPAWLLKLSKTLKGWII